MPNVSVPQLDHRSSFVRRVVVLLIPVRHDVEPIRIDHWAQHQNHVAPDALHLRRLLAGHAIPDQRRLLRSGNFGRVQPAINPDNRLPFLRQPACRGLVNLTWRQLLYRLLVAIERAHVLFAGDDRHKHLAPIARLANLLRLHALRRRRRQLLKIFRDLLVIGQVIVRPRLKSKHRSRRGRAGRTFGRRLLCRLTRRRRAQQQHAAQAYGTNAHHDFTSSVLRNKESRIVARRAALAKPRS